MADFWLKEGDLVPSITATLEDSAGNPIDINTAAVTFVMREFDAPSPIIERAAANEQVGDGSDGSKGKVRYDWVAGDTDTPGGYRAEWRVLFGDGPGTIPNNRYVTVAILPMLGSGS